MQGENYTLTSKPTKVGKSKLLPRASRDDGRVDAHPRGVKHTFAYYVLTGAISMTFSSRVVETQSTDLLWVSMVPRQGLEPWTSALPRMRSTTELPRRRGGAYSERNAVGKGKIVLTDCRGAFTCGNMSQNSKPHNEKADREARLAQALRTNLRRRKVAPAAAAKPGTLSETGESPSD